MKERPLLMSAPMVRATLEDRKTQTRRICKGARELSCARDWPLNTCPYGQPGDRLWVREAWATGNAFDHVKPRDLAKHCDDSSQPAIGYEADRERVWHPDDHGRWRPSIHMPRWASRLTLEVTGIRVERLQDIADADARAEGVQSKIEDGYGCWEDYLLGPGDGVWCDSARASFRTLWDSLNFERAPWESNPWVWVVEFRRLP